MVYAADSCSKKLAINPFTSCTPAAVCLAVFFLTNKYFQHEKTDYCCKFIAGLCRYGL
jgi:hypothetical protein